MLTIKNEALEKKLQSIARGQPARSNKSRLAEGILTKAVALGVEWVDHFLHGDRLGQVAATDNKEPDKRRR